MGFEGVLDYGVLKEPAYVIWVGLMGREDTRQKTFPRVRAEDLLPCPSGVYINRKV